MGIYDKLLSIQGELKAPKGQHNDYGNYYYRSCEDILEAVKPICKKHGAVLTLCDDVIQIGGRYYVQASAKLIDIETGEMQEVHASAREADSKKGMDESQVSGTASSYARKYALNGLFCIDDAKDADTNEYRKIADEVPKKAGGKRSGPAPMAARAKCKSCGALIEDTTWPDGTVTSAGKMVTQTIQKCGAPLCGSCYTAWAAQKNGG
nr:MAG TPA: ERF superfamily protein [Caudoviricetes sp.]